VNDNVVHIPSTILTNQMSKLEHTDGSLYGQVGSAMDIS
jgi:hypothetical protein